MPRPLENWEFYIQEDGQPIEAIAVQWEGEEDLLFSDEQEGSQKFWRRKLETSFVFQSTAYGRLLEIRTGSSPSGNSPCDKLNFILHYSNVEKWRGVLNLRKLTWLQDKCEASGGVELEDDYSCVYENWENEKNILLAGAKVSAEPFFGTLVEVTCGPVNQASPVEVEGFFETNVNGCLGGNDAAYSLKRAYIEEITPGSSYDHYATWVTEQVAFPCSGGLPDPPPGDGWVLLIDDCAGSGNATWGRPPQMAFVGEQSATTGKYWDQTYQVVGADVTEYGNGVLLSDVIQYFADDCSLTVVSDFLNINPDATAPSNSAYAASSALHHLIVYQKSDIKRPDATNPATIAFLKLKDLLESLKEIFSIYWRIEGSNLRVEHISYFEGANGDDLTVLQPDKVANRNTYSFNVEQTPPSEEYSWMDNTNDADFRGLPIIYAPGCVASEATPLQHPAGEVFTDLGAVVENADNVSDEGLFFLAADFIGGTYYVNREEGELSNTVKANAHLSWANLHENYKTWGRLLPSGTLNNVSQDFDSYQRTRQQQPVTAFYGVDDYFNLDPADKINTELGWGEIKRGEFSARRCELTLELLQDD